MKLSVPTDLTKGRPLSTLVLYALPMLVSMFFQQAYNLADGWIAGRAIGQIALGAVGTCYPVTVFLIAITSGLSLGTSIFCSLAYGGGRYRRVRTAVSTSLTAYIPLSLLLTAAGIALTPAILRALAVPEEAAPAAGTYLRLYMAGLPFLFLYNLSNGVLTGLGDSRTPLAFLILSSCVNILLDLAFVKAVPWGVGGLAFATLLSQALSSVPALWAVRRMLRALPPAEGPGEIFSAKVLRELLRLGVPSMFQHMFMSLGQLFLQNIINGCGTVVMAGYSVAFRMNGLVINSLMALSNALSGFMAQNLGAGERRRVSRGVSGALVIAFGFSLAVAALFFFGGEGLLAFFVKEDAGKAAVVTAGLGFLRVVSPFYLLVCVKIVYDGALRGIGAMTPFMLATMSDVVVRVLCGRPFFDRWGIRGVWAIWPLAWAVGTAMSLGFYLLLRRRKLRAPEKT